jgi:anti-sigma regulatory factor (Ser/Thr protein kinase)
MALCAMPATAAAVPVLRHFAGVTAKRWAVSEDALDTLALVVSELVTNVVLHSGSDEVTVLLTFGSATVTVEVKDAGTWRTRCGPRQVVEDAGAACGRGLGLIEHLATWWFAVRTATGTRMVACLPIAGTTG